MQKWGCGTVGQDAELEDLSFVKQLENTEDFRTVVEIEDTDSKSTGWEGLI